MKKEDRPILFSGPMVRAILDERKTMTRRVYKPRFDKWRVGDRLWVRETFVKYCREKTLGEGDWDFDNPIIVYRADKDNPITIEAEEAIAYGSDMVRTYGLAYAEDEGICHAWKPSIFMPRKLSRILLEITELKRELLRDVSEADALREGFENNRKFLDYFEKINPEMQGKNPEVVAIGFKVLEVKK